MGRLQPSFRKSTCPYQTFTFRPYLIPFGSHPRGFLGSRKDRRPLSGEFRVEGCTPPQDVGVRVQWMNPLSTPQVTDYTGSGSSARGGRNTPPPPYKSRKCWIGPELQAPRVGVRGSAPSAERRRISWKGFRDVHPKAKARIWP